MISLLFVYKNYYNKYIWYCNQTTNYIFHINKMTTINSKKDVYVYKKSANYSKINYPVRIHDISNCKCTQISKRIKYLKCDNKNVAYVIEKMWNDEKYKIYPRYVFIFIDCKFDHSPDDILKYLLHDNISDRNIIMDYFREYIWSSNKSTIIRSLTKNINTICYCRDSLLINKFTSNSGFVLLGNADQINIISHTFNKYVTRTEFNKLHKISLNDLSNINTSNKNHTIDLLINSNEYQTIKNKNLYTLVGQLSNSDDIKYSFSFGKREWNENKEENSFHCAKRELYEEFNIQFSNILYNKSTSMDLPKYAYQPGTILFLLYLPEDTKVNYHIPSETIYIYC